MGGLALKETYTRRYQRDEYDALEKEIFGILDKTFVKFSTPRFFASKESFGDMDVILAMEYKEGKNVANLKTYIEETFKPNQIYHNGNAWSFDYKELQIDFITCAPEDYDANRHYLAFNDLGNFIGRMAQTLGLKYGQEGLWYNHYSNGNQKSKVMISQDYPKIFKYLDLDYDRWITGFDSLEEIFEYVKTSKYYNPEIFQMHHLNKINRDRNAKRKSYTAFLEYIEGDEPNKNYSFVEVRNHKENLVKFIDEAFPEANVRLEVRRLEYEAAKSAYVTAKFNGHMVMEKYDMEGEVLGNAIKAFKQYISEMDYGYDYFILNSDEELIFKTFEAANDL